MSNKHDANVRKSTLVNFQIGLIASLLFTFFMFEVYTAKSVVYDQNLITEIPEEDPVWNEIFQVHKEPEPKTIAETRIVVKDPQEFREVPDDHLIKEMTKEFKNVEQSKTVEPFNPDAIENILPEEEPKNFPFTKVEAVPIFPGCEKLSTNEEKAACFSEKIGKIVSRKFNTDLGERYGLSGVQRIYTQFDVDASGMIKNIQIRAPHPKLEKEAKRVVNLFPEMTPGKQRGKPVTVRYQLPIVFKIQN